MQKKLFSVLPFFLVLMVGVAIGQTGRKQGLQPYTPTKLEWAVTQLRIDYAGNTLREFENVFREFHPAPDGEISDLYYLVLRQDEGRRYRSGRPPLSL